MDQSKNRNSELLTLDNAEPNAQMLILARESRRMSQADLAAAASMDQARISKYESELLNIPQATIERFAGILDYPVTFFYSSERRYGFGSSCIYNRKRLSMSVSEQKYYLAHLNICRIHVSRLLRAAEVESEVHFSRFDFDDFNGNISEIVQAVRMAWRTPPGPINSVIGAIECAGGIVYKCSFGTNKIDAMSQWVSGMPPLFFVNADVPGDRLRWTLAHEVGHVIMHRLPTLKPEQEADAFAAELLMPASEIASHLTDITWSNLVNLKLYWKVSIAALIRRARDLGKITDRQYRSMFEQMGKMGYRLNEPAPIPSEEPTLLNDIFSLHQEDQGYSLSDLGRMLDMHETELARKYQLEGNPLRVVGMGS